MTAIAIIHSEFIVHVDRRDQNKATTKLHSSGLLNKG